MKKIYLILTILLGLTSCQQKKGIETTDINQKCTANEITNEQLADLLYAKNLQDVQFVDIRTPHKYAIEHLPNAINIPMKNFFDKKYFNQIPKDKILIIYGEDASTPRLMALLSGHFKKGTFYVALGGYQYIQDKILNGYHLYSGLYNDEEPLVDYTEAIQDIKSRYGGSGNVKSVKKATPSKPIVKHKKKEVTGGCG